MVVEHSLSYILSPTEVGYQSFPSHDVKHPKLVLTPHEVPHRSTLHLYHMRADENKEELQSYYNIREEDLEEKTKDWWEELLIPADPVEMSDPELIRLSPETTHEAKDTHETNRRKKIEEVQNLRSASE
jgi:hypothetical protein